MDNRLIETLRYVNRTLDEEGFVIVGIFGSRARGDEREDSDLDVLYRLEERFYRRYRGWDAVGRMEEIREELRLLTGYAVDLANASSLGGIGKKYILPETVYIL